MSDAIPCAEFESDDVPSRETARPVRQTSDRASGARTENRQLADHVREKLASTGYHQLLRIDVAAEGSQIRLSGRVGRYYLLQVAQQAVLETDGVEELQNELQVVRTPSGQ